MMTLSPRIALILLLLTPSLSFATAGKIVDYKPDCGYLLIEGAKGFLFLKQQGGSHALKKDDVIEGFNIESYGISHLRNVTTNETVWIYNEHTWLSKDDATNKYVAKCGPIKTNPILDLFKPKPEKPKPEKPESEKPKNLLMPSQ